MLKKIFFSIFFPVVFLGGMFVLTPAFSADFGLKQTASEAGYDLQKTNPTGYVEIIVSLILGFSATIFFGMIIYGGFIWLLARGNDEKVTAAKGVLETAIIGLVIVSASYAISRFILSRVTGGETGGGEIGCCYVGDADTGTPSTENDCVTDDSGEKSWQSEVCEG